MKEFDNYLWDKTGENAEIAELENALAAFRYKETAPPALPAKILSFPAQAATKPLAEQSPRRVPLRFALAACAATVFVILGALFQLAGDKTATDNDSAQTFSINKSNNKEIAEESDEETRSGSIAETESLTLENVETSPQVEVSRRIIKQFEETLAINKSKIVKIRRAAAKQNKPLARNAELPKTTSAAALTDEEKYAYDQLMLALSVTSKQLKIVKDKVNGIENQTDDLANEK